MVTRRLICRGETRRIATGFAVIFGMMGLVGFRRLLFGRLVPLYKCSSTGIRERFERFTA